MEGIDINEFYNELSIQIWGRVKSRNDFWDDEERLRQYAADKSTRNELREVDAALRRLEANDYTLWKKLASHIPLPNKGMSEEECAKICKNYTGTYEQFRQDHLEVIGRFTSIANLKSNDYETGSELIAKYCSHMKCEKIQWKTITANEVLGMIKDCESKKDVRLNFDANLTQKVKRYEHLKPVLDFYNELPNTPTGIKVGQRRGGGWKHK